jgi:sialic acid synthase SpsE
MSHLFDVVNVYGDIASNHGGDPKVYERLVRDIEGAGAIPKIQLFNPKTFNRDWPLPKTWVPSVFDLEGLAFAMQHSPLALKVASVESTRYELVRKCGETGLPLLVSTGGMTDEELVDLCEVLDPFSGNVCLMHCVSVYPTPLEQACMTRISMIADLMEDMLLQPFVGWSNHCPDFGRLLPVALAYDAKQLEFHVRPTDSIKTLDEQCAVNIMSLDYIVREADLLMPVFGDPYDEDYIPPDREGILEWRKRWQRGEV